MGVSGYLVGSWSSWIVHYVGEGRSSYKMREKRTPLLIGQETLMDRARDPLLSGQGAPHSYVVRRPAMDGGRVYLKNGHTPFWKAHPIVSGSGL